MGKKVRGEGVGIRGKLLFLAREMRHEPTAAEKLLWEHLRDRKMCGCKFRRQQLIGRFVVDFCCPGENLVIEIDGAVHNQQQEADQEREDFLTAHGYRVIRFSNTQVQENIDQVLRQIEQALRVGKPRNNQ